jgi:hypothetical protein
MLPAAAPISCLVSEWCNSERAWPSFFLDSTAKGPKADTAAAKGTPPAVKQQAAVSAGWFLGTTDAWAHKFFDPHDLHLIDRELFAG